MQRRRLGSFATLTVLCVLCLLGGCKKSHDASNNSKTAIIKVGVIEPMQHIAVSDVTRGIRDVLKESDDASRHFEVLVKNASGDKTLVGQIAAALRDDGSDVFVPIFTSTAQAVVSTIRDKAIVFAAVTDPKGAGLVQDLQHPGGRITGVSDLWPISDQFDLIAEIVPTAKRIGMVYDPSDPSSAATEPLINADISKRGWSLVVRPVTSASEITQSLQSLGDIDAIFTANDVTVTAAFPSLVSFCVARQIPLFAGDYSSVQRGAIAAVGQNYYNVGRAAGAAVVQISKGTEPGNIPVKFTSGGDLHVNVKAAQMMGVKLPQALLSRAVQKYNSIADTGSNQE